MTRTTKKNMTTNTTICRKNAARERPSSSGA
jgi:hypothetical protein